MMLGGGYFPKISVSPISLALVENQERTDFSKLAPLKHNFPFGKSASEVLRCCERAEPQNISYTFPFLPLKYKPECAQVKIGP